VEAQEKIGQLESGTIDDAPPEPVVVRPRHSASTWGRSRARRSDAPLCYQCGSKMQPAGSCYVCGTCGSTSGCS
jgi:ribonucleoside-diphosphate reductase alpha chain